MNRNQHKKSTFSVGNKMKYRELDRKEISTEVLVQFQWQQAELPSQTAIKVKGSSLEHVSIS